MSDRPLVGVISVHFRHVYTFGGSFHCETSMCGGTVIEEYGFGEPFEEDELEG